MSILVFLPGNILGKDLALRDPISSDWVTVLHLEGFISRSWEVEGRGKPVCGVAESEWHLRYIQREQV